VTTALAERTVDGTIGAPRAGTRASVIEGALACFARYGVSKTNVEDVAREARLSRATLYRAFPGGTDELVAAVVDHEVRRLFRTLEEALAGVEDLEELLVVAMTTAVEVIDSHEALNFLLEHEPELVWPHVAFGELDQVLALAANFFEPYLAGRLDLENARRVGEWIARIVLSHVVSPPAASPAHPAPGTAWVRRVVVSFVLPGIRALESTRPGPAQPHRTCWSLSPLPTTT